MDTSKEYIKMCDCPEIQKKWKLTSIDFHGIPCADSHDYTQIVFRPDKNNKSVQTVVTIWLPRQDQIQGMLLNDGDWVRWALGVDEDTTPFELMFSRLMQTYGGGLWNKFAIPSGEQLWLAFYMFEKHKKKWDGKKWKQ